MDLWKSSVEGLVMQNEFWKGKRVLITGYTGFKGGWLSLWLQSLGADVSGYSLEAPTTPSLYDVGRVGDAMSADITGDVCNLHKLIEVFKTQKPEIVFHMAAQPLVRYSYDNPVETYQTNVMGTVHLLEAVRQINSVKVVVNVTSDKCYDNREWVWGYRENEPMGGYDPYSNSKGCAELVTSAYRCSYFNPQTYKDHGVGLATVRAGNVIGGGDWAADRLVPDVIQSFHKGQAVVIRSPKAIRPWQHVLDPLCGYMTLAEKLWFEGDQFSGAWNFGPNETDAKAVEWIVNELAELWGGGASWTKDVGNQPHEANFLKLDCSKAKSRLNWVPKWGLGNSLKNVISWYQAFYAGDDMKAFTLDQIKKYSEFSKVD